MKTRRITKKIIPNDVNEDKIKEILLKKAVGYTSEEVVEEYQLKEDELMLTKRKVTSKQVPPDLSSAKVVLEYFAREGDLTNLTDEELLEERNRLIEILSKTKEEEDGTCEDQCDDKV